MTYKSDSIAIIGGGTAGWITAATLVKTFPNKKIVVIESDSIPTIGVGESTLKGFNYWLSYIGIDKASFMRETDASFKVGVSFLDFFDKNNEEVFYVFGSPDLYDTKYGIKDWMIKKVTSPNDDILSYSEYYWKHSYAIKNRKVIDRDIEEIKEFDLLEDMAFQVDAKKLAIWLRDEFCIKKGVTRIVSTVQDIRLNESGIESILLSNGDSLSFDLYVDCSGFKSILLGKKMNSEFIDTKDMLPNNKAWFGPRSYLNKDLEMDLTTRCIGMSNGWIWNTPLWSRVGMGYIFSDENIDQDSALEEFKAYLDSDKMAVVDKNRSKSMNFNLIEVKNGYHKTPWIKNVVAIGLSHGFLEPMESTGIQLIIKGAMSLSDSLSRSKFTQWDIDKFNNSMSFTYENFFKFVSDHYALSLRDDTTYWKKITSKSLSYNLDSSFDNLIDGNVSQVYVGAGDSRNFLYGDLFKIGLNNRNKEFLDINQHYNARIEKINRVRKQMDMCPSHYEYLRDNIYEI